MTRFVVRALHYLGAFLNGKLDEVMDPRVQIEQAITEAKRQHALLSEQAGAVIANQREIEIKISRADAEIARLRRCAEQALTLADRARKSGDPASADDHERTARVFAVQLASAEASAHGLGELHAKSLVASGAARRAVEQNRFVLERQLNQRAHLLSELEAAKLAERMTAALNQVSGISTAAAVPTLADVRDRIDERFARATGQGEIASGSIDARMLDTERSVIDREGEERLEEIRKQLGLAAPNA